jgi:hypothetical protein
VPVTVPLPDHAKARSAVRMIPFCAGREAPGSPIAIAATSSGLDSSGHYLPSALPVSVLAEGAASLPRRPPRASVVPRRLQASSSGHSEPPAGDACVPGDPVWTPNGEPAGARQRQPRPDSSPRSGFPHPIASGARAAIPNPFRPRSLPGSHPAAPRPPRRARERQREQPIAGTLLHDCFESALVVTRRRATRSPDLT